MIDDIFELSRQLLINYNRPYKRYFHHQYPLESRFSVIIGPRGTGKTTVIIQNILSTFNNDIFTRKALYVPVDHFIVVGKSLYEIAEEFYNFGGECICFDEIHKWPKWSGDLKSIYDSFPKLRIIASGSSAILIQKGSHDLSRRAIVYREIGGKKKGFRQIKNAPESFLAVDDVEMGIGKKIPLWLFGFLY